MNGIDVKEARSLIECEVQDSYALFARAHQVRLENRGTAVRLCGVVNAKSGQCTEDCKFCAQSAHNDADIGCYPMINSTEMIEASRTGARNRAARFGIVSSGLALTDTAEVDIVADAVASISKAGEILPCASLGNLDRAALKRFQAAGLTRYHCNLETAESFFKEVCTTREWSDSADTIRTAKELGMDTCCGGIIGLGESLAQRVELLDAIRALDVDSVPLNFLHPIPGTPLEDQAHLTSLECLRFVAVARLMMPDKEIRVCGGREQNLRDLQSWALISGADGLMVGGYLTTSGRDVADDLKMIADAGFEIAD